MTPLECTLHYCHSPFTQLEKIVAGYTGLARSLNDQLMQELVTKDELLAEQDRLLETISEMTDNLV